MLLRDGDNCRYCGVRVTWIGWKVESNRKVHNNAPMPVPSTTAETPQFVYSGVDSGARVRG